MQKYFNFFVKLISYCYAIGLIILITMLGSPFALVAIYPVAMLSIYFPLAGVWGIIPYPLIESLSKLSPPVGFVLYYLILIPTITCQFLILKRALYCISVNRRHDKVFKIMCLHHIITGGFILVFFYIYPSVRDFQRGFNVLSVEYLPLAQLGFYGLVVNLISSTVIKKWRQIENKLSD